MQRLILASSSPRRRDLLAQAGYSFEVIPADIDERKLDEETAASYVARLATEKARAVLTANPDARVLGADTAVVLGDSVLGKPADIGDAERMLRSLSGQVHSVLTGVAVTSPGQELVHVEQTHVYFGEIDDQDLRTYLASRDALDKAGAYGIQGYAARWVNRIEGDYFNVMGLPIAAMVGLLKRSNVL